MRVIEVCTVVSMRDILRRFVVELAIAATLVTVSVTVGWNGNAMAIFHYSGQNLFEGFSVIGCWALMLYKEFAVWI